MNQLYLKGSKKESFQEFSIPVRQRSFAPLISLGHTLSLLCILFVGSVSMAQAQQLELYSGSANTSAQGPVVTTQTATFLRNTGTSGTFNTFTPATTFSVSISSPQAYTTSTYPGLTFGGASKSSNTSTLGSVDIFTTLDAIGDPLDSYFTSGPNSTAGTNFDVSTNYGYYLFTDSYYQVGQPLTARNFYANITVTFSRPVINPVLHFSGMGGAYNATGTPDTQGYYTELELSTADVGAGRTLTRLSGSSHFVLDALVGTKILNNATAQSTSSTDPYADTQQNAGAGSVRVNSGGAGITSVTFRVYLKGDGGTNPSAIWGHSSSKIGRPGDAWMISASLGLYTINGTVYNDANGLTDNTIVSATTVTGTAMPQTPSGTVPLYASLVQNGNVIGTVPVTSTGTYSFSVVDNDTYTVVLTTNSLGNTTSSLPTSWISTGENFGAGTGTDGIVDGALSVTIASANVANANFGIERLPTPCSGSATVANTGGTSPVTVPPTAFTSISASSDPAPGTVTSIRITTFPTNATSLTINGTVYTAASTEFTSGTGVVVATNGSGAPTIPILVDPTIDSNPVVISFKAIDNAGKESTTTGTATINSTLMTTVSGTVWNDADGNLMLNGLETVTNTGGTIYVNLVNGSGTVVGSTTVAADGTYSLAAPTGTTGLKLVLTSSASSTTPGTLPTGWVNTGENVDPMNTAVQSTTLGRIELTTGTTSVTGQNFGIEQTPTPGSGSNTVANAGGTNGVTVPANTFTNSTPSADTAPGSVTAIRITTFPSNVSSLTINVTAYTASSTAFTSGTGVVVATDGSGNPSVPIIVNPTVDTSPVVFTFRAVDNAGKESTTTGTATLNSTTPLPVSGTVWNDADGNRTLNGLETGTNAASTIYVNLINASGAVVASTTVTAAGNYTLSAPASTTGLKLVLTNTASSTTPGTLPTGWVNTGENVGATNTATQSTVVGQIELTTVSTSVTAQNFGIEQLPTPGSGTAIVTNAGGTTPVTVPPNAFTSTSPSTDTAPGSVTAIRITTFPSNVTSLTINGVTYTAGSTAFTSGTGVIVPTTSNGTPTVPILVDPTNDANPVSFTFVAIDNAGKESTTSGTAVLNFIGVPDLTPIIYALPGTLHNTTNITYVVDVVELKGVNSSGLITVKVTKDALTSMTFVSGATSVGGKSVQNSVWSFDNTDEDVYLFTTSASVLANNKLSFGLIGVMTPGASTGTLTVSVVIVGGSGGEVRTTNNIDADKIDYFQQ